jgi:EAL domain-containing protein (putative c-di-GMP-specific phosphodiesterase class I)
LPFEEVTDPAAPRVRRVCLAHRPDPDQEPVLVPLHRTPFRIGRSRDAHLVLESPRVSKAHAEIRSRHEGGYVVRDLGSRNGTFVNGDRIETDTPIDVGDVLHVANREISMVLAEVAERPHDQTWAGESESREIDLFRGLRDLYRVLRGKRVAAVFQPIVRLEDGSPVGFEALGRNTLDSDEYDTATLFRIATENHKSTDLSRLMRTVALGAVPDLPPGDTRIFMNVHSQEMGASDLLFELERTSRAIAPRTLVVEVHEAAIADLGAMRELRAELDRLGIELAYDDFGAGRSRLTQLAEVPPDFLKLDMSLIRGIEASPGRKELVSALLRVMRDVGVRVVAEGVETRPEHETMVRLGCELGQGFLYRRPAAAELLGGHDTAPDP